MSEELNTEEEITEEVSTSDESSEETEVEEDSTQVQADPGESKEEYTKERHDGLMSAWQKDKSKLKEFEDQAKVNLKKQGESSDDMLIDHLRAKMKGKDLAEKAKQDEVTKSQLAELRIEYPGLASKDIVKTAVDYSDDDKPISLKTAAKILNNANATGELSKEDAERKANAGKIAGRAGVQVGSKIRAYDPKKDKGKSIDELADEGAKELGLN